MYTIILILFSIIPSLTQSLYNHQASSYVNSSWMGLLDNGIPIRKLSIIGSHCSMSTGVWGDAFQTQSNSLMGQMVSGIRALDMRCRHYNNAFQLHDRLTYLNTNLAGVLTTVRTFLQSNPRQVILMHIVQQYNPSGNSRSFQQTYISYRDTFSDIIWIPTTQDPVLGQVRGKVVIIQDFSGLAIHGLLYSTFTVLPHKWFNTNWDLYDKWTAVKNFLLAANTAGVSRISFWTGHGGSFPYFVASGKSSPGNTAGRLVTGLTTPGFSSSYPDFPRVACFFTLCSIVFEGINILAFNRINSQAYTFYGIVYTDFVGDLLLQKFVSSNTGKFVPCPATLLTQGCTYCSSTGQCLGCNTTINYIYNSPNSSCLAANGYYLSWSTATDNIPVICSNPMLGCLSCLSSTVCTLCDTFANYQLVNGTCGAAPGFYLNASGIPVKCTIVGCYQCISATVCGVCSAINNYIITGTNTCQCNAVNLFVPAPIPIESCICQIGYFLSNNGTCESIPLCPNNGSGCLNCSIGVPTVCVQCDTANNFAVYAANTALCSCIDSYYFDGLDCISCNLTLSAACLICVSDSLCITCVTNFTLLNGDCTCLPQYYVFDADTCLHCPIGCLNCDNASVCLLCDSANNFTLISTVCQCNPGLFLNGLICQPCNALVGCLTCNTLGCTGCNTILGFNLNATTSLCQCNYGYFINSMQICQPCTQLGCLDCLSLTNCTVCDTTYFYLNTGQCLDICGDGFLYTLPCDDGNLVNGDGCSSLCNVETDYTCVGGSTTSPSLCSFSGTMAVDLNSIIKDPTANRVYLQATIQPPLLQLSTLDFNAVFLPNFPIQSSSVFYDPISGNISMIFDYNQSLNSLSLSVSFVPPATPTFFYMKTSTVYLPQTTDNNLALKSYDSEIYNKIAMIQLLIWILAISATATFMICFLIVSKLMAIQMILIFQLAYSALLMIKKLQPFMLPLRNLWMVNGYNQLLADSPLGPLPARLRSIYYKGSFLSNFSIDIVIVVIPIIIGSIFIIIGKVLGNKNRRIQGYKTLKEWLISALLFVQLHMDISIFLGLSFSTDKMIGLVAGTILELLLVIQLILFVCRPKNFGQYKKFFKNGSIAQKWYILVVIVRTILTVVIGNFGDNEMALFGAAGLFGVFAIIQIIIRPYISNVRPIINSIFITLILGIYSYTKVNQDSESVTFLTSYISIFIIGLLFTALLFNIICIIAHKVGKYRDKKNKQLQNDAFIENDTESKQLDKVYINKIKEQLKDSLIIYPTSPVQVPQQSKQLVQNKKSKDIKEKIVRLDAGPQCSQRQRINSQTEEVFDLV